MPSRIRPVEKFAAAVAHCSKEVCHTLYIQDQSLILLQCTAYGKCIVADYNNVKKDKCVKEFLRLQECYVVR
jgi:hypothetical protein